jgi:hypothetical protein
LFDRVLSPTKYHSPLRNQRRDAPDQITDKDGDDNEEEEEDSELDLEEKDDNLRTKIGTRPVPLSQKTINHPTPTPTHISQPDFGQKTKSGTGSKVFFLGTSPSPKAKPRQRARTRQPPSQSQLRVRQVQPRTRGIRSEARAPISISVASTPSASSVSSASTSTGSFAAHSSSISTTTSSGSSGVGFNPFSTDGELDLEVDDDDDKDHLDVNPEVELGLGLRSLRVSSGRFEDAPEHDLDPHVGMGIGLVLDSDLGRRMPSSDSGLDSGSRRGSRLRALELGEAEAEEDEKDGENGDNKQKEEEDGKKEEEEGEEEEKEEHEIVLPILRRRTRKNQPRASRASMSSGSSSALPAGNVRPSEVARPRRGRKVVVSPESSQPGSPVHEMEEKAEKEDEDDLIVVLPPRKTTPVRSLSPAENRVESKQDPIELVQASLKALDLVEPRGPLQALLDLCGQPSAPDFSSFLLTHTFGLADEHELELEHEQGEKTAGSNGFRKVGEASYSEVYALVLNDLPGKSKSKPKPKGRSGGGKKKQVGTTTMAMARETGLVIKVIPLIKQAKQSSSDDGDHDGGEEEDEEVACSLVADVKREIEITRLMSGMGEGFVRCHG